MLIPITDDKNIVFYNDDPNLETDVFIFTLKCIIQLFDEYLPRNNSRSLMILLDDSDDSPICYKKENTILLNTEPFLWSQAAYQFSHEYCHYMIPDDVCENLRWFEESICELSSHFFFRFFRNYG